MPAFKQHTESHRNNFSSWLKQHQLDSWLQLLGHAYPEIASIAQDVGIDWSVLQAQLPATGVLLKGTQVPVLSLKDRGRSSFVWYLHRDALGNLWPCLVFMSFRHGGLQHVFHTRKWAWDQYQQRAPLSSGLTSKARVISAQQSRAQQQQQIAWRLRRFTDYCERWKYSLAATPEHPILAQRLTGYADAALLKRVALRSTQNNRGPALLARLLNHQQGHCGFQQLNPAGAERRQDIIIRQEGLKRASMICIHAEQDYLDWPVAICEGLFTGLSIALAWPGPIAVALDAGNLQAVRQRIKRRCVFFADNDAWSASNTGVLAAQRACLTGDHLQIAQFQAQHAGLRPTDFNDLLCLEGIAALHQQVSQAWPTHHGQVA